MLSGGNRRQAVKSVGCPLEVAGLEVIGQVGIIIPGQCRLLGGEVPALADGHSVNGLEGCVGVTVVRAQSLGIFEGLCIFLR